MIETIIEKLTEALNKNTAALKAILSAGAAEPAPTTTPKPKAEKAAKPKVEKTPAPAPVAEPVAPAAEDEDEDESDTTTEVATVPDLAIPELRDALKKTIKDKMFADPLAKNTFATTRAKYGIQLLAELSDEQVRPFYEEVLTW